MNTTLPFTKMAPNALLQVTFKDTDCGLNNRKAYNQRKVGDRQLML